MNLTISKLKEEIKKIVAQFGISKDFKVIFSIPEDLNHGDFTTNIAFKVSLKVKKPPLVIAENIVKNLTENKTIYEYFEKIEVIKPAFINFYLNRKQLLLKLKNNLANPESIGVSLSMKNKKIAIEFTDPNPFKEFHIGHVYTNTVGEAICRLFEANGAKVWRADYFGDVGMHVAKSIWGLEMILKEDKITFDQLSKKNLKERIKYLGKGYARGSSEYEKNILVQKDIKIINKIIYIAAQEMWRREKNIKAEIDYKKDFKLQQEELEKIYTIYTAGRNWSLEYFETIYTRLGMKFDGYYPESIAGEKGYKIVMNHISDGIFEFHEGAIVFRGEKYGLHTRVFINSLGLPTYEAKELGLAPWKYEDFPYDESIIITGNEIEEYFKVLIAAMTAVNPELGLKTRHLSHGMVRLPEGKMSSRTGKIITGEWILHESIKHAEVISDHKILKGQSKIFEAIGIGAVKYAFLKSGIGRDIEFDFQTSLNLNGNSGPYLQYTYVRTQSVLNNAEKKLRYAHITATQIEPDILNKQEIDLLRVANQFELVVEEAAKNLAPSVLCSYLYIIAKQYNTFYQSYRIIDAESSNIALFRTALSEYIGLILRQGLYFLGIDAPKRM